MNGNTVRINISLPSDLVKDLKKRTSKREFSKFLAEAAIEKIEKEKRSKSLKKLLEGPPAFPEVKDSVAWVKKSRREDEKRLKRLGI